MHSPEFRTILRDRTRLAHQALDTMIGPVESIERYRDYLRGFQAHRAAVDAWLEKALWPIGFGGWRPTLIAPLVAADLADLGMEAPAVRPLDVPADMSSAVGVAYVAEGSSLGARLIAKMAAGLGLDGARGARHLAAQERSVLNWRAFLGVIEGDGTIDRDAAVAAAVGTFEHAARAMNDNGFS